MSTITRPEDLKHGDHVTVYETDGTLLYDDLTFTKVYRAAFTEELPLDFKIEDAPVIVEFWSRQKKDFIDFSAHGAGHQICSPHGELRTFEVTGHGWGASHE